MTKEEVVEVLNKILRSLHDRRAEIMDLKAEADARGDNREYDRLAEQFDDIEAALDDGTSFRDYFKHRA